MITADTLTMVSDARKSIDGAMEAIEALRNKEKRLHPYGNERSAELRVLGDKLEQIDNRVRDLYG